MSRMGKPDLQPLFRREGRTTHQNPGAWQIHGAFWKPLHHHGHVAKIEASDRFEKESSPPNARLDEPHPKVGSRTGQDKTGKAGSRPNIQQRMPLWDRPEQEQGIADMAQKKGLG